MASGCQPRREVADRTRVDDLALLVVCLVLVCREADALVHTHHVSFQDVNIDRLVILLGRRRGRRRRGELACDRIERTIRLALGHWWRDHGGSFHGPVHQHGIHVDVILFRELRAQCVDLAPSIASAEALSSSICDEEKVSEGPGAEQRGGGGGPSP
jgi:hypothetical protein